MLSKDHRLRYNNDILRVLRNGKRHYFSGVLLYYIDNSLDQSRISFVVSKKTSSLAVKRNFQKRILRHVVQKLLPQITPGKDIVISYTNHNKMLPYKEAQKVLFNLLKTNNLLTK